MLAYPLAPEGEDVPSISRLLAVFSTARTNRDAMDMLLYRFFPIVGGE